MTGEMSSPLAPSDERTWAIAAHAGTFVAAWFAMGFLCPLVIWLVFRERSDFVRRHALESLNFQLSLLIYTLIGIVLVVVTFGLGVLIAFPLLLIGAVAALIVIILASVAAANGQDYRYPLTLRLVR